jgi:voltage-gated potassium channel Kch
VILTKLLLAWSLMAVCVAIHAFGLTSALRWLRGKPSLMDGKFLPATWMLIRVAGWVLLLHLLEISLWAFVYYWSQSLPDLDSAYYFSAVTYTTTGYGDIVLPQPWRMVGAVEALTGILMCGWSTAFFFAVVTRRKESAGKGQTS